jgi:uncharacterized protein YgbK (DUF1537 family)
MTIAIGVIADDVTGGTDVATAMARAGMRTAVHFGQPDDGAEVADAVVIALKSRTIEPDRAVRMTEAAADWLLGNGAERLYFKYCSTFDSTPRGNIGPALDALADRVGARHVVTTPSSPEHGRTQYLGRLFVGDLLLEESPMRNHPLTPMTDSDLPRLLRAQTAYPVDLVRLDVVRHGPAALRAILDASPARYLLADAVDDSELDSLAEAAREEKLTAGAAGLAGALARLLAADRERAPAHPVGGARAVVLAGSCSQRTLEQVDAMIAAGRPHFRLDVLAYPDSAQLAAAAIVWFDALPPGQSPLFVASATPERLHAAHAVLGVERSAELVESALGRIAVDVALRGVDRIVVAGGETAGAVIEALGVRGGVVGAEAAPGVPWIHASGGLTLLLKSGNFGPVDLLVTATEGLA